MKQHQLLFGVIFMSFMVFMVKKGFYERTTR